MKLGVCVPYRNREEHMNKFVPHIHKFLNDRGIEHVIYLGHQCDDKLFNRGLMKNVAAKAAFDDGCDYRIEPSTARTTIPNKKRTNFYLTLNSGLAIKNELCAIQGAS
jgi:hypothetical protein